MKTLMIIAAMMVAPMIALGGTIVDYSGINTNGHMGFAAMVVGRANAEISDNLPANVEMQPPCEWCKMHGLDKNTTFRKGGPSQNTDGQGI